MHEAAGLPGLSAQEAAAWSAWKAAGDGVWEAVARAITAETGLSGADFAVLSRLVEDAGGRCRQQELADRLGWQRPRISRQVTRMQQRDLLTRSASGGARSIAVTEAGRAALGAARPVHAAAVRRALLARAPLDSHGFWDVVRTLAGPALADPATAAT